MNQGGRMEVTPPECALASEMFDHFCAAATMKHILALHREICNRLSLKPNRLPDFYPKLKEKLASSWKALALFRKFDARANHKVYAKGRACAQNKVLIIGAGPCGLRAAIECQLLGAKVVVVEKRDRISRNNVLHLWPFVIHDLKALGAKKFFGKFCAGSIEHISIRQLQCILLKVALLLGVEFHEGVGFEELLEPTVTKKSEILGWRARVSPAQHPVSQYEFDVLIGADGKRNTLPGFKRKEFRGRLAMAITANFINRHSEIEAAVPEISGVACIFNQKFFKELNEETGIDLENIVYYKDDTHYFVMTAKKHSLLAKGVLLNDYPEVTRLLSVENVDRDALMRYAQEAARFSTNGRLPLQDFALNHYGDPDVALFDFTSMYAAENASTVMERHGRRVLCQLVGDSLLEPFWPTGSGCARGFLSALDAAWAVRAWGHAPAPHPLAVVAERESIYRLLAQTTPENLQRDLSAYTLDPSTRYPNLNRSAVSPHRVTAFYDADEPLPLDATATPRKRRREAEVSEEVLVSWVLGGAGAGAGADAGAGAGAAGGVRAATAPGALAALVRRYRPDLLPAAAAPAAAVYHVLHNHFGITPLSSSGSLRDIPETKIKSYLARIYNAFKGEVPHIHHDSQVFDQLKLSMQKEKHSRHSLDQSLSAYSAAAETDNTNSSSKRKRRSLRPQVSNDQTDLIRKKIGKLDLNDITNLARLIETHDAVPLDGACTEKQKDLQEQILALLDPEDSPDPQQLRDSLAQLLQGNTKTKVTREESKLIHFFHDKNNRPVKPPRRLKGLDPNTIKIPHYDLEESFDTDVTVVNSNRKSRESSVSKNSREPSVEVNIRSGIPIAQGRRPSAIIERTRHSQSPEVKKRSHSIGATEIVNAQRMAQLFEGSRRRHTPSPESKSSRSGSMTDEMAMRLRRMTEIIEGKRRDTPSPDRIKPESIGNPEMEIRKNRVVSLIEGQKRPLAELTQRRNSGEMSFRMQRVSDIMQKKNAEAKRPKTSRRKAAREIMKQRFEKSLQMLATEPRLEIAPSADLDNDYGLQQYRASAIDFEDRVKILERQLQHYEEGRIVGSAGRMPGGGARVAQLAAELAGGNTPTAPAKPNKPKDLMRSVGKIMRDDWNMKQIEMKIQENKLGRPEPKTAERVPKWDREQFLGRQRRLKEGDNDEKWGEIDETLQKFDVKKNDSGRPKHGTKKVANLATKFVNEPEPPTKTKPDDKARKSWRGPSAAGVQCAACGTRVFAAEGVTADGLQLHRACFRCAVCKAALRPGNYTMERYGKRLVCLRHSGVSVTDRGAAADATPERIALELSDSGAREIDEDEWTDRNCLASETSPAGLSDEEDSSSEEYTSAGESEAEAARAGDEARHSPPARRHDMYYSDDSFGYDDYSDDGGESSGNESCSRMREAREARRREVPTEARPPSCSSEVESEEESSSSDEVSSGTEVSTDSEFARDEAPVAAAPPAITVTEPPPAAHDYPLNRARSAGGLATKRALELKRKYLLGEPSPPAVRKSDSTSQIDTKFEAVRSNITEFQKMLNPATSQTPKSAVVFRSAEEKAKPMPDIIKNLCTAAPVDLLSKTDFSLHKGYEKPDPSEEKREPDLESDSLSEDESSHTETAPQCVPRVEVHDEGGELIQLDSLMLVHSCTEDNEKASATATATGPTVLAVDSESSESGKDATTLALTETELSDWVADAVADDCAFEDRDRKRNKNPRTLGQPKLIHDAKNMAAAASHVCGRDSPTEGIGAIAFSNALEHFEFADEGDQDPSIETPSTPKNEGYMELVDDEFEYSPANDRSMNFIERSFSETVVKSYDPHSNTEIVHTIPKEIEDTYAESDHQSPQKAENESSDRSTTDTKNTDVVSETVSKTVLSNGLEPSIESMSITEVSPQSKSNPLFGTKTTTESETLDDISPPLVPDTPTSKSNSILSSPGVGGGVSLRIYSPAICRSASETFNRSTSRSTDSPTRSFEMSLSVNLSSGSTSPISPVRDTTDKVQEINRERQEQTEVVRRLVLERLGGPRNKRERRERLPPPVPPPPALPAPPPPPPPPPRPAPPLLPAMPVTPSLSDPELARERRRTTIMKSISNYLNRHLGPRHKWASEPNLTSHPEPSGVSHKSTGALCQEAPPVPPPPACYCPPKSSSPPRMQASCEEREAMQLWFEARWARLVAQRRARERSHLEHTQRSLARLQRRLSRPLSAEQQAATVAELVQVSARRDAHDALLKADRRRSATSGE